MGRASVKPAAVEVAACCQLQVMAMDQRPKGGSLGMSEVASRMLLSGISATEPSRWQ